MELCGIRKPMVLTSTRHPGIDLLDLEGTEKLRRFCDSELSRQKRHRILHQEDLYTSTGRWLLQIPPRPWMRHFGTLTGMLFFFFLRFCCPHARWRSSLQRTGLLVSLQALGGFWVGFGRGRVLKSKSKTFQEGPGSGVAGCLGE